jgi:hypothetical protein
MSNDNMSNDKMSNDKMSNDKMSNYIMSNIYPHTIWLSPNTCDGHLTPVGARGQMISTFCLPTFWTCTFESRINLCGQKEWLKNATKTILIEGVTMSAFTAMQCDQVIV